jgi:hypothetical protein
MPITIIALIVIIHFQVAIFLLADIRSELRKLNNKK